MIKTKSDSQSIRLMGTKVPYIYLAHVFEALSGTSKRLVKLRVLTNLFRSAFRVTPDQLEDIMWVINGYSGIFVTFQQVSVH